MTNDIWSEEIRKNVLGDVKEYFDLYLFSKATINLKNEVKNIFNLDEHDFNYFKSIHFLMSSEVKDFIEILPQLMKNLSHSTNKHEMVYRGIIQGNVNWNKTYKKRFSQGFDDKSLFVCNSNSKLYDLEENQLLKFMLKELIKNYNIVKFKDKNWQSSFYNDNLLVKTIFSSIYFQNISNLSHITPKILRKVSNHRNTFYKYVVKVYKLYHKIFIVEDPQELINLVSKQILEPTDNNDLYELYVFFRLVSKLPHNDKLKLGLLRKGNDYAANYNDEILIHYQNIPLDFQKNSLYKDILSNYNLKGTLKRPDIIIEFKLNNQSYYRIVEVKRANNDNNYIYNSVYKVMAYYKDFQVKYTDDIPIVLVVWGEMKLIKKDEAFSSKILILNKDEFDEYLCKLIKVGD